jgi:hypothetical protein
MASMSRAGFAMISLDDDETTTVISQLSDIKGAAGNPTRYPVCHDGEDQTVTATA